MRSKQFQREADMLAPISEQAARLLPGRDIETLFEVQTSAGIPDIVFVEFNKETLKEREARLPSFIVNFADMCVLLTLSTTLDETTTATALANKVPFSAKYIGSKILPRLTECGYVQKQSRGRWQLVSQYKSAAKYIGTLEVKINDWRSGYSQTLRHRASADESWLVLASCHSSQALAHREWFERAGIGLATLHPHDGVDHVVNPRVRKSRQSFDIYRELLAERAAHLYCKGEVSGTIGLVFGADLTTTTGPDPRRSNAAEGLQARAAVHSTSA
ncbi:hypothetical protein [Streptomyces sp. NPDC055992]|uniref:hypothetical protein n=1 Tax=Streptomyces sp. NPDC055992 TaxID=3345673 RepID=UPI0035DBDA93